MGMASNRKWRRRAARVTSARTAVERSEAAWLREILGSHPKMMRALARARA